MEFITNLEVIEWKSSGSMKKGKALVKWAVELVVEDNGIWLSFEKAGDFDPCKVKEKG